MRTIKSFSIITLLACGIATIHNHAIAQLQVSISQTGTAANSCTRTLTANVQNGSGNYSYFWSITTPGISFPGPNTFQVVNISLNQTVDVMVTVTDHDTGNIVNASTTVYRVLQGDFNIFMPNLITPNGDGYNDIWVVTDASKGYSPINAYSYSLTFVNSSNVTVYRSTGTVTSNHLGILGWDIQWNARYNGTGSIVPKGVYSYSLILQNCSQSRTYNGQITVMY